MPGHDSIDTVITEMDRVIERSIDSTDARGWFAIVYRAVTAQVRSGLEAGEFDDAERMELFDVRFARYWLDAHTAWDRDEPVSASWAVAFEAARRPGLILQHLVLGMNAHINLDLGVAAATTCPGPGVADLRDDFERINDVLAQLVDRMQLAIAEVSPVTRSLDAVGLRFDEALTCFSLEHARRRSWDFAALLAVEIGDLRTGGTVSGAGRALIASRDAAVARNGARIADPGRPLRWLLPLARYRERADLASVADALRERGPLPG